VFFTDDARVPDPLPAIRALPPGSMVVLRHRNAAKRRKLAEAVAPIARARRLAWIIAGDPVLASEMRAHGVHFAESNIAAAARWRVKRPRWLITCAAHSLSACARASRSGVNAIFLAPVFATQSHPGRSVLGPLRTRLIANLVAPSIQLPHHSPWPAKSRPSSRAAPFVWVAGSSPAMEKKMGMGIYALGGIDSCSAKRLVGAHLSGLAAIGALMIVPTGHRG
jgi:thiamine-phosphate pyrophosphorylase